MARHRVDDLPAAGARPARRVTPLSPIQAQIERYFPPATHPYRRLEQAIAAHVGPQACVLDIGCGRTAPTLRTFAGRAARLHGVDLVPFTVRDGDLELHQGSVTDMHFLSSGSVDVAYSRSVMEHIEDVHGAFVEVARVLKPGGRYIFLTPSRYDYASLVATLVPNRLHPRIVHLTSGRAEEDVFPTFYRANSRAQIGRLARAAGLAVDEFRYLNQYPDYLQFSRPLFWLGCQYGRLLARVPPLRFMQGWVFSILRKPDLPTP